MATKARVERSVPVRITPEAMEDEKWGPAMTALNVRQRAFVVAAYTLGGDNATDWAIAAGYKDSGGQGITVQASRLMKNPRIVDAFREYVDVHLVGRIPELTALLMKISRKDGHKNQFDAIKHALALGGVRVIEEKKVTHEHVVTIKEKWKKVMLLAKERGDDPLLLLENLDPEERAVIEAEFEEVHDADEH